MKKSIIALLVLICMLFSLVPVFVHAEESSYEYYIKYLETIGLIDETFPEEYEYITRGQVAFYISKLYGEEFGTSNLVSRYSDVPADNPYFESIELVSARNVMIGYSDGNFYPDKPVTYTELTKVLTELLGYTFEAKLNGGYPTGYLYSANKTGLLKDIDFYDGYIDCGVFAHFIYNALFIDLALPVGITMGEAENYNQIEIVNGKNIMTYYLNLYKKEGTVVANNYISIKGQVAEKDSLIIDDNSYKIENPFYNEYIGCKVEFVYSVDEVSEEKVIKIMEFENKKSQREFNFCGSYIFDADGLTLTYFEGGKENKLVISPVADIVYNFKVVDFSASLFDNPYCQKYKFIDNDGDKKIDFIIIEKLESMVAGIVNTTTGVITDKFAPHRKITLSKDKYDVVLIFDNQGNEIKKEEITEGATLTYIINGKTVKCYVSFDSVTGRVESVYNGEQIVYTVGGTEYKLFPKTVISSAYLGKDVNLYIDAFGFISGVFENQTGGLNRGYLISAYPRVKNNEDQYIISIFTQNDKMESFFVADILKFNGKTTKLTSLPQTFPQTLILYELNDEGKIKTIETPVEDVNYEIGRLRRSYTKKDDAGKLLSSYHYNVQKAFDQTLTYDDKTTVFDVVRLPAGTPLTEDNISIRTFGFSERTSYIVEGYNYSEDGMVTDIIVNWVSYKTGGSIPNEDNLFVVSELSVMYDDVEGCAKTVLKGFSLGKPVVFKISSDYITDFTNSNFEKGDILRYAVNNANEITLVEKIFDLSEGCKWKGYTYPEGVAVSGNPRFVFGRVVAFDSRYVRYINPKDYITFSGFLGDCIATRTNYMPNITIIEKGSGSNIIIKSGSKLTDIEPGDFILEYTTQQQLRDSVIFKGFDKL